MSLPRSGRAREAVEQPLGEVAERGEAVIDGLALAEAVVDVEERDPTRARGGLIARGVPDEHRATEPVSPRQRGEVVRLRPARVPPALEVPEAAPEARPAEELLDVAPLAVADDEERIARAESPDTGLHVRVELPAPLPHEPVVLELRLRDER